MKISRHLILIAIVLQTTAARADSTATAKRPIVLGYYPSWSTEVSPAAIRYELFTHLAHAFVTCTSEGLIRTQGNLPSRELVERAHAGGTRVLVSVGGAESGPLLSAAATSATARQQLVAGLRELVEKWGYDGIDLDWEFPQNAAERDALTSLARELRSAIGRHRLLVTAQMGNDWGCRYVDMEALRDVMDWVAVMTYDMHGPWSTHAGHNAPIHKSSEDPFEGCTSNTVTDYMNYWRLRGKWPAERLLLGIPCYGRGFRAKLHAALPPNAKQHPRAYVPFREIATLLQQGWKRHVDPIARVPWLESPDGRECLSYEDEKSARHKGEWARSQGFGGIFFWEITQDRVAPTRHAIIEAARVGFLGSSP